MSYLEYYQLKEQPFSTSVDNRFYYNSKQHADALVYLKHAAEYQKGLALLVGDIGAGKTTLAQRLLDGLDDDHFESALLVVLHTTITSEWLLRKIAVQLGVEKPAEDKTELLGQLYNRLAEINEKGKKAVVLVDEAQMLRTKELMEEFRGLLNLELDGKKLITFIFFALPEMDEYLGLDEPLRQRVAIRYYLQAFTEDATSDYIKFRLKVAGGQKELFTESAYSAVHQYSKGIPRLINIICDNALLEGFLRKKERIGHEMIREIATDLKLPASE
jgi:type II secretory pathway predicted ATPase ExeA